MSGVILSKVASTCSHDVAPPANQSVMRFYADGRCIRSAMQILKADFYTLRFTRQIKWQIWSRVWDERIFCRLKYSLRMVVPTPRLRVTLRNVVNRCKSRTEMGEIIRVAIWYCALDPIHYSIHSLRALIDRTILFSIFYCESKIRSRLLWTFGGIRVGCCDLRSTSHECILRHATINKNCALELEKAGPFLAAFPFASYLPICSYK